MSKKLKIEQVSNGYIVRIKSYGRSHLKEPFPDFREVKVFPTLHALKDYISVFFSGEESEDPES